MKKILILIASQNKNKELAQHINVSFESKGVVVTLVDLVALDLPLYSSVQQAKVGIPSEINALFEACENSHGFVFVAPEYNGGIPPVLTNALAWLSVKGKHWREVFNRKVAGSATFSGGEGMNLIIGLRTQLAYVGLTIIGRTLQVNYKKELNPESLVDFTDQIVSKL
ncbi:MAG: NAD(P)H-dependent oxidoreductase [Candidatus Margulisiibacteriota bacterium]